MVSMEEAMIEIKPMEKKGKFHLCTCQTEGIIAERWDWDGKPEHDQVAISMWTSGVFRQRSALWQIWQIIRHGQPVSREIILSLDEAQKFGEELLEMSKE